MQRPRLILANLLTVAASVLVTLVLAEVVLRFLPVAWAPPVEPPTAENPIQRYVASTPFTWSLGWNFYVVVHGRTNAQGFVANYDYDAKATPPLVAVAGDSYVEALMVPFRETLTGRLQTMLGNRGRAYAFAQSGAPLSQYVAYAKHACAVYRPERLIVVVVGNDFDESIHAYRRRDGIYHLYPRPEGGFDYKLTPLPRPRLTERLARHSALALYLARNVGIASLLLERIGIAHAQAAAEPPSPYVGNTEATADAARIAEGEEVIAWFLDALPRAACLEPRDIALVIDAPRPHLYDATTRAAARASYFGRMRSTLMAQAGARGFKIVDMEPHFLAAHTADGVPFENPTDGHWNSHGHAVVAAAVREALTGWPPLESGQARSRAN